MKNIVEITLKKSSNPHRISERLGFFVLGCYFIFLFFFTAQVLAQLLPGKTYYISVDGSDSGLGTIASPFKTLKYTCHNIVKPGDTVIVRDGVYNVSSPDDGCDLYRSGTSSGWITFKSEHKWGAKLNGNNNSSYQAFSINPSVGYIKIQDFEISGFAGAGINIENESVLTAANNIEISGNNIHDIGRICTDSAYGKVGIFVGNNAKSILINRNMIHDIGRLGPNEKGCAPTTNYYMNHDHGLYLDGVNGITVTNNIFYNNIRGWDIQVWDDPGPPLTSNALIANNTFASHNPYRIGQILLGYPGVKDSTIENNIFNLPPTAGVALTTTTGAVFSNINTYSNIVYGGAINSGTAGGVSFTNNMVGINPSFVNLNTYDFHLQASSPAINAGVVVPQVSDDFDGNARNIGSAYDIGACLFSGSGKETYDLNVSTTGKGFGVVFGSTTTSNNLIDCGTNPDATICSAIVNSGTNVTLMAVAASESAFGGWTFTGSSPGTCVGKTSTCIVTINAASSIVANFIPTLPIIITTGTGGTISPPVGTMSVNYGADQIFTVTPQAGYLPGLKVDGVAVTLNDNAYTLRNITAAHTVAASFNLQTENIMASAGTGGTITPSGAVNVDYATDQIFTVTPKAGYIPTLTVDGTAVTLIDNTYTLNNVTAPHTVVASFGLQVETITASASSGGMITPSGTVSVNYGENQTFTVTPKTGYTPELTVDGVAVVLSNNTYTLSNVTVGHTVNVSFTQNTYVVTVSAGNGGTISPMSTTVAYGSDQVFTVKPNAGYIPKLVVDGAVVTLTDNTYTLTNVTTAHSISVEFTLQTEIIMVTAGPNGSISPSGALKVNYGTSQLFTLSPNAAYTASLTVDGVPVTLTNNTYTLMNVIAEHTVVASFAPQAKETITTTVGQGGTMTPSSATVDYSATSPIFTITPDAGYIISQLLVDGVLQDFIPSGLTYFFSNVIANHNVSVTFSLKTVAPVITVQPTSVTVTASTTPPAVAELSVTATSVPAPTFQWQVSTDGGATFNNVGGASTAVLTTASSSYELLGVTTAYSGYKYQCVVTNGVSPAVISNVVTLTVNSTVISPDGTVLNPGPTGSLVTSAGTWTFSSTTAIGGYWFLLNGEQVGIGVLLLVYDKGQMYTENSLGNWYVWNGSNWTAVAFDPRIPLSPYHRIGQSSMRTDLAN